MAPGGDSCTTRMKAEERCDDAWHLGFISNPTLRLGGGMSPTNPLITQMTAPEFYFKPRNIKPVQHGAHRRPRCSATAACEHRSRGRGHLEVVNLDVVHAGAQQHRPGLAPIEAVLSCTHGTRWGHMAQPASQKMRSVSPCRATLVQGTGCVETGRAVCACAVARQPH